MIISRFGSALALVMMTFCAGCGNNGPSLGTVTGVVKIDETPLANHIVEFQPKFPNGTASIGKTNDEGEFELQFTRNKKGAMVGEHGVRLLSLSGGPSPSVPNQYSGYQSPLTFTVEPGPNEFNITVQANAPSPSP